MIRNEGAQAVIHQGDLDYDHNPAGWDQMINDHLGANFPYFVSIGDADKDEWDGPSGYQARLEARLQRIGIPWSGTLGLKSSLSFNGLFIILSGVDIRETGHDAYIRQQLAADNSIWRIVSWHKNMRLMQVVNKTDETGWGVYEESRLGGAIIATGHAHSYSRTHLLSSMQNQTIASTANTLHIEKGKTFVFVHEIGGHGIRSQELSGSWWASIYTRSQNAEYGALFGVFHYQGQPNKAYFYMKNLRGEIIDSFTVISHVNEQPSTPSLHLTIPNGGEIWEIGTTRTLNWTSTNFSNPVKLEYSVNDGSAWTTIAANESNDGVYAWTIAAPASTQARVRVSDAADGDPSDLSDNSFTLTDIPFTPTALSATATSSSNITLNWTDHSGIEDGYKIERKTGAGGSYSQIAVAGANATSYSDNGLAANTTYFYRVRASAGGGDSDYSNEANATTWATAQPPAAPGNLTATAVSSSQINLLWQDNSSNETGFEIDRATTSGGPYTQITTTGANVTTYSNTGLSPNTTYYYRVRATNAAGDSDNSNEAFATTQSPPPPPAAPTNLTANAVSSSQINLAWQDNSSDETGFEIDRATTSGGPYTQIATTGANVTTYSNTGLSPNTTYYYRVRATNVAGDSPNSNEASAMTLAAPAGNLALNKPATASSTYSSFAASRAVDGTSSGSSYWRSATVSKPAPNTWLRVDLGAAFDLTRAVIRWKENYFASRYRFQISNSGGNSDGDWTTVYTNNAGTAGTQDVTFSSPFAARYFRIRMDQNNKANNQVYELECYAGGAAKAGLPLESGAAAISEAGNQLDLLHVYPNPFNPATVIAYVVPEESHVTLKVYNLAGQEVVVLVEGNLPAGRYHATFHAGHLPSGLYFTVLQAGTARQARRLVLMK
ncbi:fibronectin type III domain-containing protein [bacterium]|nr:fibronectin type III domain-containing protein [bacterium]